MPCWMGDREHTQHDGARDNRSELWGGGGTADSLEVVFVQIALQKQCARRRRLCGSPPVAVFAEQAELPVEDDYLPWG